MHCRSKRACAGRAASVQVEPCRSVSSYMLKAFHSRLLRVSSSKFAGYNYKKNKSSHNNEWTWFSMCSTAGTKTKITTTLIHSRRMRNNTKLEMLSGDWLAKDCAGFGLAFSGASDKLFFAFLSSFWQQRSRYR